MHALIMEPDLSGHHAQYLAHLIDALHELGVRTTVLTHQGASERIEFAVHLSAQRERATFDCTCPIGGEGMRRVAYARAQALRDGLRRHRPDHLLVPYVDGLTQVVTAMEISGQRVIPRGLESEVLLFRGGFAYPGLERGARLQHLASRGLLSLSPWSIVHFLDPLPFARISRLDRALYPRRRLMPEPVEPPPNVDRVSARRALGIPEHGRYISLVGGLDRRKGTELLLRAFCDANFDASTRLLLAGPIAQDMEPHFKGAVADLIARGQIITINRHLPVEQLMLALVASDLAATPYPNHIGSASIVIRAAAAERPLLGSTFGWIGDVVPRFQLGWSCNVNDPVAFAHELRRSLDHASDWQPSSAARRFARFHSVDNFRAHWTSELRKRLGLGPSPGLVTWSEVHADR